MLIYTYDKRAWFKGAFMNNVEFVQEKKLGDYFDGEISPSTAVALAVSYVNMINKISGKETISQDNVKKALQECFSHEVKGEKVDISKVLSALLQEEIAGDEMLSALHKSAVDLRVKQGENLDKKDFALQGRKASLMRDKIEKVKGNFQAQKGTFASAKLGLYDAQSFAEKMANAFMPKEVILASCEKFKPKFQESEADYIASLTTLCNYVADNLVEDEASIVIAERLMQ